MERLILEQNKSNQRKGTLIKMTEVILDEQTSLYLFYHNNREWICCSLERIAENTYLYSATGIDIQLSLDLTEDDDFVYAIRLNSEFGTRVKLELVSTASSDCAWYHIVPGNHFGDNNLAKTGPGAYPHLTEQYPENEFCSPSWSLRADRAALPIALMSNSQVNYGISVDPYACEQCDQSDLENQVIRNGLIISLPNRIGVLLGYENTPGTFVEKEWLGEPTRQMCYKANIKGKIYCRLGDRLSIHKIIRNLYEGSRQVPTFQKHFTEAITALRKTFFEINWGPSESIFNKSFYRNGSIDFDSQVIGEKNRAIAEIAWTGMAPLMYALQISEKVSEEDFPYPVSGDPESLSRMIIDAYNEDSKLFNDVALDTVPHKPFWDNIPLDATSRNNGWWAGYVVGNQHSAYNNGQACYYLLQTLPRLEFSAERKYPEALAVVNQVLQTAIDLQSADGNFAYTYHEKKPAVESFDGFAGCWFAAACAKAYQVNSKVRFLEAAKKAVSFYYTFVKELNCYGTPMDTHLSIDQEGVLAFVKASKLLHEITSENIYLEYLEAGAHYEYLWRYGFQAIPEYAPLKGSNWNSCGGSLTSVSNPHIHPMGLLIVEELYYLAEHTQNTYHSDRAYDSIAWAMNTLELYPEVTQFGRYGMTTERYCPSDGLVVEKNRDGSPYSVWLCYNAWAAAAMLEGISTYYRLKENL